MRLGMGLGLGNLLSGQPLTGFPNDFSFNLDGSNDYLDTGNSFESLFKESFTISAWIKLNDGQPSAINAIFNTRNGLTSYLYFQVEDTGKMKFVHATATEKELSILTDNVIFSDGASDWTHVAGVFSKSSNTSGSVTIYVNGQNAGSSSSPASGWNTDNYSNTFNVAVGALNNSNSFIRNFDGLIDEVAVWSVALSADDIAKIASKPVDFSKASTYATDRTANLKLWLRAGDKVLPEEDKSIARSDFYTDFDGTDDHIAGVGQSFTGAFSISFWIKPYNVTDSGVGILGTTTLDSNYIRQFSQSVNIRTAGSGSTYGTGNVLVADEWIYLAITRDSSNVLKWFVNGSYIGSSATQSGTFTFDNFARSVSGYFDGAISNVSLYQTALDAQTIKQFAKSRYTPMRDNRFSVVDFDGSDDYIKVDADSSINNLFATGGTFTAWVNVGSAGEVSGRVAEKGFIIYTSTTSGSTCKLSIEAPFSTTNGHWTTTNHEINFGEWQHIAITYDGSSASNEAIMYFNGSSVAVTNDISPVGTISADTADLYIGNRSDTARSYNGSMSSFALYSTAKSAEEIYALYSKGITYNESSESGLVGYWRMGDDTSKAYPTIADSSSNSNDGTITNGASDDIVQQMVAGYDMGAFESSSEELGGDFARAVVADNWYAYSNMTVNTITGGVSIVAPTTASGVAVSSNGAFIHFRGGTFSGENQLTTKDLEIGKIYSVTFNAFYSGGASGVYADIYNSSESVFSDEFTTTSTSYTIVFEAKNATTGLLRFQQIKLDNTVYITDITVKEVLQSADLSDTYPAIIDVNEPVLGVDQVTNGTFDSDANWTKGTGWSIGSGVASCDGTQTGSTALVQQGTISGANLDFEVGKTYKITFDVTTTAGAISFVEIGGTTNQTDVPATASTATRYLTASSTNDRLRISGNSTFEGTVDNVVVKEVFGNVGTMTQMDGVSNLVYSSVLPDQSFLTGVNSAYNFLDFDGTDANVSFGNIELAGEFTLISWIYINSFSVGKAFVIWGDTDNNDWFRITSATTADIKIANSQSTWTHGATFTTGEWQHIAVVRNSSNEVSIYRNGIHYNDNAPTKSGTFVPEVLGRKDNQYLDGNLSNNALYNKQLSSIEISAIYTSNRHTNLLDSYSDNLKAYFAFGALDAVTGLADTDSTIYDRSGNSNHGTTSGTATGDLKSPPNAEPNGYAKGDTNRSTTTP
ncbi:hypothetical protein [uncultured Mediterranean phage uvMED]|nr:hypothetical protein [uncultured Mediterranean phage uvMED]